MARSFGLRYRRMRCVRPAARTGCDKAGRWLEGSRPRRCRPRRGLTTGETDHSRSTPRPGSFESVEHPRSTLTPRVHREKHRLADRVGGVNRVVVTRSGRREALRRTVTRHDILRRPADVAAHVVGASLWRQGRPCRHGLVRSFPARDQKLWRMPKTMLRPRSGDCFLTNDVCASANSSPRLLPRA